jgi:hypothetical protein
MEKLADLPPAALITLGITLAVIIGVRYIGLLSGEKTGPENKAPVAAVIVDSTALNRLTDQAARLNENFDEFNERAREKIRVDGLLATELDRIREELRIQREIARRP